MFVSVYYTVIGTNEFPKTYDVIKIQPMKHQVKNIFLPFAGTLNVKPGVNKIIGANKHTLKVLRRNITSKGYVFFSFMATLLTATKPMDTRAYKFMAITALVVFVLNRGSLCSYLGCGEGSVICSTYSFEGAYG